MMGRICHQIQQVFPEKFLSKKEAFDSNLEGIHFDLGGNYENLVWSEAKEVITGGGGGNLFISASGDKFFADSEGEPPEFHYSGSVLCNNNSQQVAGGSRGDQ